MDPATRKAALDKAASLLIADPSAAERAARAVLQAAPSDPNATLILGSALRRLGRPDEAVTVLQPLVQTFPRADLSRYEFGLALADAGEVSRATDQLTQATSLNPENSDAWRALGSLLFDQGDAPGAEAALDAHSRTIVRDPRLRPAADALYLARQPVEAEGMLRPIIRDSPDDLLALSLLAEALSRTGRNAEAADILIRVLDAAPENHQVRFRLARELEAQQRSTDALVHLERLASAEPENPAYRNLTAGVLAQSGEFDRAVDLYEGLVTDHGNHPSTWANYAHTLRVVGRSQDAIAAYRRAIALDPRLADGYLGLANLKAATFTDAEVAEMAKLSDRPDLSEADRQRLGFALGQALEDRGDYAGAFAHYADAAASRRAETPYDPDVFTRLTQRIAQLMSASFFEERAGFGADDADPIFIVGLPRSGSTLVEQILASHPSVEGLGELPDLEAVGARLGPFPEGVRAMQPEQAVRLGEAYIAATRDRRKLGRPFFIDKMPNNFQFVGLIQLLLPRAKIIDVRRDPMATGFSLFKQHFARGQPFSYEWVDIGHFYRDYVRLMEHFDRVLPGRVHRVIYEDLVESPEAETRRLLAYCGLEFDPQCLAFHETQRPVRTPSSEQVRRPLFREGLDQWRNFEPWLDPLEQALGSALKSWRGA